MHKSATDPRRRAGGCTRPVQVGRPQHGTSWCYTPPGYTDVPESLHDKAASFRSDANTAVYAIDWARDTCFYRLIRAHDLADNWPWGARLDGVSDTTMGCEVG